jgi:hypothetical protein
MYYKVYILQIYNERQGIRNFVLTCTMIFFSDQNTGVIRKEKNIGKFINT